VKTLPDISQITAFMVVSEELSFKRAAERLAIDPSAVSRRIKELEATLGFALFYRSTHDVRLTDAGRRFYDGSLDIVGTLRDTIATASRVAKGNIGHIRIAYMTFAGLNILPTALTEYRKLFPELAVSLSYQPTQDQRISLVRGEIDVGLMLGPFKHSEFDVLNVASECLYVAMPAQHPLARKKEVSVSDFSEEPMVMGTDRQWDFYRSLVGPL
jgi:LysR family transcriptional regulator, benzoate and cis,cis-muconate-responsive activator of ben and cat genes